MLLFVALVGDKGHHYAQLTRQVHRFLLLRLCELVVQKQVGFVSLAQPLLLDLQLPHTW
jgi:hypothetical protein